MSYNNSYEDSTVFVEHKNTERGYTTDYASCATCYVGCECNTTNGWYDTRSSAKCDSSSSCNSKMSNRSYAKLGGHKICYKAKTCSEGGYVDACNDNQIGTAVTYNSKTCYICTDCSWACPSGYYTAAPTYYKLDKSDYKYQICNGNTGKTNTTLCYKGEKMTCAEIGKENGKTWSSTKSAICATNVHVSGSDGTCYQCADKTCAEINSNYKTSCGTGYTATATGKTGSDGTCYTCKYTKCTVTCKVSGTLNNVKMTCNIDSIEGCKNKYSWFGGVTFDMDVKKLSNGSCAKNYTNGAMTFLGEYEHGTDKVCAFKRKTNCLLIDSKSAYRTCTGSSATSSTACSASFTPGWETITSATSFSCSF